jgi:predicted Zn-dependent peptidase
VESNYQPYTDTGMFNIYFGTDKKELERAKTLVYKELDLLCTRRLGTMQLSRAKKQMLGQMALSMESPANLMMNNGKSYLLFGRTEPFERIVKRVEGISSTDLLDTANEILKPDRLSTLIYMKS